MISSPSFPPARRASGFTLIEVALALGVVAFAFVGLIALLPAGLNNFRSSMNISIGSQIFQQIVNDAEQADFDALVKQETPDGTGFAVLPLRYFDDEGNEIVPSAPPGLTPQEAQKVVYYVHIRASNPGPSDVTSDGPTYFTSLPSQGTPFNPRFSTILTVQVAVNPANITLQEDSTRRLWTPQQKIGSSTANLQMTTYSAVVTRNGYNSTSTTGS
jgi:uncharacterized protein (TIGR02598 family)